MLSGVYNIINVIMVYNFYQYNQGYTTPIMNVIRDVVFINIMRGVQPLSMLSWCIPIFLNVIRGVQPYQYYKGCTITIINDITHPCNYILTLLHTPGVINKSLMTLMNMITHL